MTESKPAGVVLRETPVYARHWWDVEHSTELVLARSSHYDGGMRVGDHRHSRSQLLFPAYGMLSVSARDGRWLVPAGHALWIPAGVTHSVDMIGAVRTHSVYVRPDALPGLPEHLHVAAMSPLLEHLIIEAEGEFGPGEETRQHHIYGALLQEIRRLPELPLGLPLPGSPRLLRLCRAYLQAPGGPAAIDDWAKAAGMSRRTFTRIFRAETGLGLSGWRQQACLMAALPRLARGARVTSVALDLGYDSVPAFTTMFTRALGISPRAYMKTMRRG